MTLKKIFGRLRKQVPNEAADDAVRQRWKLIRPTEDYPPKMPEHFEIESLSEFDPKNRWPALGELPLFAKWQLGQ